jgi:hypothetical protein
MPEFPIIPTSAVEIENESAARNAYFSIYQAAVDRYGLKSREQFVAAQCARDTGLFSQEFGLWLVFIAFSQWFGNECPRDDWTTDDAIVGHLQPHGEPVLAEWIRVISQNDDPLQAMQDVWGDCDRWIQAQKESGSPWGNAPINL